MSINHQMPQVAAYRDGLLEGHSWARDTGLRERTSGAARRSSDFGSQQVSDHFSLAVMEKDEAFLLSDQAHPSTDGWTRPAGETRAFAIALHRNPFPCFAKTGVVTQSSWRSVPDPSAFYVNPRRIEPSENRRILLIITLDQRDCAKFDAQTNASVSLSVRADQPPFGDHSLSKDIFALPRGISVRPNRGLIPAASGFDSAGDSHFGWRVIHSLQGRGVVAELS